MTLHAPSYAGGFASPERGLIDRSLWNGVVGAWAPSLGATGLTLRDNSLHGSDGTIAGATESEAWADVPRGMTFDGTDDYVALTKSVNYSHSITISAWVRINAADHSYEIAVGRDTDGSNRGYILSKGGITVERWHFILGAGGTSAISATSITTDLTHIVGTHDGVTMKIYVNGELDGSAANTTTATGSSAYNLGRRAFSSHEQYLNGTIDDTTIWSRALSANEIQTLHRLGPGGMYRRKRRVIASNPIAAPAAGRINSLIGVGGGMIGYGGGMIGRGY